MQKSFYFICNDFIYIVLFEIEFCFFILYFRKTLTNENMLYQLNSIGKCRKEKKIDFPLFFLHWTMILWQCVSWYWQSHNDSLHCHGLFFFFVISITVIRQSRQKIFIYVFWMEQLSLSNHFIDVIWKMKN